MSPTNIFAPRLKRLVSYIEHPELFALRNRVLHDVYLKLKQPWIQELEIAVVFDIGANVGQSAATMRAAFPHAFIYSFEPVPSCYEQLKHYMSGVDKFEAFNIGLGDQSGELSFQQNAFTPSSSFLSMADSHKQAFPFTSQSTDIPVKVERLDDIVAQLNVVDPLLVKVDVQGYEGHVLRGGEKTIGRAEMVILETSFQTLYEGQPLFDELYQMMIQWGFFYMGSIDQLENPMTGETIQADSLFLKKQKV